MRINRVYTKQGDQGETQLVGGKRVPKDSPRVAAYGDVDELNSAIGVVRSTLASAASAAKSKAPKWKADADALLARIQNDLFIVGADLASPPELEAPRVEARHTAALEKAIDEYLKTLEPLKEFILPGGSEPSAQLHLARAVCRRAERAVVVLSRAESVNPQLIVYLNRLSDLLFVLARVVNKHLGAPEEPVRFRD